MNPSRQFFITLFFAISLFSTIAHAKNGDRVGDQLHNFSFIDPSGAQAKLSDYQGEVVLVKLWATWCGVCKAKWPDYQKLYSAVKDQPGVRIVTLSIFEDPADSQAWVNGQGFDVPLYKNLINNKGAVGVAAGEDYFVKGTPMVFLLDKQGVVKKKTIGFKGVINEQDIRSLL